MQNKQLTGRFLCSCFLFWLLVSSLLNGCFFQSYVKQSRFANKIHHYQTVKKQAPIDVLLGEPQKNVKGVGTLRIQKKGSIVLQLSYPKYKGFCSSLTVHIAPNAQDDGHYRVWFGMTPYGPWQPVGYANGTKTFDIDGATFYQTRYIKIEDQTQHGPTVSLDGLEMKIHPKSWKPPYQPNDISKKAKKEAQALYKRAHQAYQKDDNKTALALLKSALYKDMDNLYVHMLLGSIYHAQQKNYKAIKHYNFSLRKQKRAPPRVYQELGDLYLRLHLPAPADRSLRSCVNGYPFQLDCYKARLRAANLFKSKQKFIMYRDQYVIIRKRSILGNQKLSMPAFFDRFFTSKRPAIMESPKSFDFPEHLEWFRFMSRLFPERKTQLLYHSSTALRLRRESKPQKTEQYRGAYYLAKLFYFGGNTPRALALLRNLKNKKIGPQLGGKIYLALGYILSKMEQEQQAHIIYQEGAKRFAKHLPTKALFLLKLQNKFEDLDIHQGSW